MLNSKQVGRTNVMTQATITKLNELFATAETLDKKVANLANGVKITAELKGMKSEATEAETLINNIKATAQEYRRIYLWSGKYKEEIEMMDFEAVIKEYKDEIMALARRI